MNAFVRNVYQLVWSTKYRAPVLVKEDRMRLFAYISSLLENKNCECHAVGGVDDHIHIVTHIHQTIAVATLVKDIKLATHDFLRDEGLCRGFAAWQRGYAALSYHVSAVEDLKAYVRNQELHHADRASDYKRELMALLDEHKVLYDENYLDCRA